MRAKSIEAVRRILCVFPRYTSAFGTFEHAYPLTDGVMAFMPPQGLLLIAAYLPSTWPVRFIDENIRPATREDFEWAEAVFVSGMHIQRYQMNDICRRAHVFDLPVALGGPSVSACPDYYPSFDYLHVGELGDATNELIVRLARDPSRIAELEKLRECGMTDTVYFVDDNFIGNRKAALDLLPHLVEWQKKTGFVTRLACEATLNIAKRPEI